MRRIRGRVLFIRLVSLIRIFVFVSGREGKGRERGG